jgi:hypothetical protein
MPRRIALVVLLIAIAGCLQLTADDKELVKTIISAAGTTAAKFFSKKEIVTDQNGHLVRILNYLTEDFARKNGFTIQIDEYDRAGFPAKSIMIYTDENTSTTGFTKRIDYVNERGELLKADFFIGEMLAFTATTDDLSSFERYPPYRMAKYAEDNHNEAIKESEYLVETPIFGGTTFVTVVNSVKDIDAREKFLIVNWAKMQDADGIAELYDKKVFVREEGLAVWVCFQDELLQFLKPDLSMTCGTTTLESRLKA